MYNVQPVQAPGGPVRHPAHSHANPPRKKPPGKDGGGPSQTSGPTLDRYFKRGAASGPQASTAPSGDQLQPSGQERWPRELGTLGASQSSIAGTATAEVGTSGKSQGNSAWKGGPPPRGENRSRLHSSSSAACTDDAQQHDTACNSEVGHATVLRARLTNTRNQCYMNALVTCLHQLCQAGHGIIGQLHEVIERISQQHEVNVLQIEGWKPALIGWRRPMQQHDVTELLQHLTSGLQGIPLQGSWAEHRPCITDPARLVDHSPTLPFVSISLGRAGSLQQVLDNWSRRGGNVLVQPPQLLILSLRGFTFHNGRVAKTRQLVTISRSLNVVACGGADSPAHRADQAQTWFPFAVSSMPYELLGGTIHIGDLAHTGHHGAFTITGDGSGRDLNPQNVYMHDDNVELVLSSRANINQIHTNTYVLAYRLSAVASSAPRSS